MKSILTLLKSTEEHLAQADTNLKKLEQLKFEKVAASKLQQLLVKYADTRRLLRDRKEKILSILLRSALLAGGDRYYPKHESHNHYEIFSLGIRRRPLPWLGTDGNYSPAQFVDRCGESLYFALCEEMVTTIKWFLENAPKNQAGEIQKLSQLTHELRDIVELQVA